MMGADLIGALLALGGALTTTVSFTFFVRRAMVKGNPLDGAMGSLWVNVLVFLPLSIAIYFPDLGLNLTSVLAFVGAGLLGSFTVRILFYSGTKRVGASRMTPIFRSDILVASAIAILFMGEEITIGHLIGIFLLTVGVMVISREIETGGTDSRFKISLNLLVPFAAMFLSGLSRPLAKVGLSENTPPIVGLSLKFTAALIAMVAYFALKGRPILEPLRADERKLYLGAGAMSSISMLLFYLSLDVSRVVVMMPFRGLTPLFVLVVSYLFLGKLERITKWIVLGSVIVIAGAVLVGIYM